MPKNKNKNHIKPYHPTIRFGFLLLILISSLLFLPVRSTKAVGLPFGGTLAFVSPPFVIPPTLVTPLIVCPGVAYVFNIGPGPTYLRLMLPPIEPRAYYNYYTPGVVVLGTYLPIPVLPPLSINCPISGINPSVYFGTSAVPTSLLPGAAGSITGGGRGLFEGGASGGAGGGDGY